MRRLILLFTIAILMVGTGYGAFNAATAWDVRTTGNDANGGGFQVGATGTDRSQSDAAYQAYTDIVVGATTTQGTSVLFPFGATTPGNIINITGGVGCTVQRVQAVSQAAGVVTFDKSLGVAASVCTGNLGGSLLTMAAVAALVVSENTVHVKAGTYTVTVGISTTAVAQTWTGYNATHNDRGTKPLITTATDGVVLFTLNGAVRHLVSNISFSSTAATRNVGLTHAGGAGGDLTVVACVFDGFTRGIQLASYLQAAVIGSEIKNSYQQGLYTTIGLTLIGCYIHHNSFAGGVTGVQNNSGLGTNVDRSIFAYNDTNFSVTMSVSYMASITNSVFANAVASHGVHNYSGTAQAVFNNNVFWGNAAWGLALSSTTSFDILALGTNAFGGNGSGDIGQSGSATMVTPRYEGTRITVVSDPFTNAAGGDFSLNNVVNGGALLKAAGFPGIFPGGTSTGYPDIGAVQTAGGGIRGSAFVSMNRLYRRWGLTPWEHEKQGPEWPILGGMTLLVGGAFLITGRPWR